MHSTSQHWRFLTHTPRFASFISCHFPLEMTEQWIGNPHLLFISRILLSYTHLTSENLQPPRHYLVVQFFYLGLFMRLPWCLLSLFLCDLQCPPNNGLRSVYGFCRERGAWRAGHPKWGETCVPILLESHLHAGIEIPNKAPKLWEIKPTGIKPKNRLEDTRCNGKEALMLVLQDEVSSGQAHPGQLKQAIYFLACKSLPQILIGWVLWGR